MHVQHECLDLYNLAWTWRAGVAYCARPHMCLASRCGFMYKALHGPGKQVRVHVQGPQGVFSCARPHMGLASRHLFMCELLTSAWPPGVASCKD